jgi:AP-3 complex subunit sigma
MIKSLLIFNTRGQARFLKFFDGCPVETQQKFQREIFQMVSKRDVTSCNVIEHEDMKVLYRQYATLYFALVIDENESEYDIYEFIHGLVQCLDRHFENVCELDLIFHSDKISQIVNEVLMGGFIVERNIETVVSDTELQAKIEREDSGVLNNMGSKLKSAVNTKREKLKIDLQKKFDNK